MKKILKLAKVKMLGKRPLIFLITSDLTLKRLLKKAMKYQRKLTLNCFLYFYGLVVVHLEVQVR